MILAMNCSDVNNLISSPPLARRESEQSEFINSPTVLGDAFESTKESVPSLITQSL